VVQKKNIKEVDLIRPPPKIAEGEGYIPPDFGLLEGSPHLTPGSLSQHMSIHNRESFNFNDDEL
jgi:hypothetical protein